MNINWFLSLLIENNFYDSLRFENLFKVISCFSNKNIFTKLTNDMKKLNFDNINILILFGD